MTPKARSRIALLVETSRSYGREVLMGAAHFARTLNDWSLLHQEMSIDAAMPQWIGEFQVQGVMARVDQHNIQSLRALNIPVIDVRCHMTNVEFPQVDTDDRLVAQMAFDHLWERGFRRFAFCGYQHARYSESRLSHFREFVSNAGCRLMVYETNAGSDQALSRIEESGVYEMETLADWLQSLPQPTGVFVCNDIRGQQVLNACRVAEIAVPEDVAVIGVDNDDAICQLCDPPLTSVRPNSWAVGYRAAEILHECLRGGSSTRNMEYVPPIGVVDRLSTQVSAVEDREVARVCQFIRQHACDGINVRDVENYSRISRRHLERRFREALNRTLHEEITANQIGRVKQLLAETSMTLEQIAPLAGYSHKERLSTVFKRETGMTPGQFRQQFSVS